MGVAPGTLYRVRHDCRVCGHPDLQTVLAFGDMPIADRLLSPDKPFDDPRVPLTLMFCPVCSLVQIAETVDREVLFGADYPYFSSTSTAFVEHARRAAEALIEQRSLGTHSVVMEIASNDGYLLRHFAERGIPVLGVDPARAQARTAVGHGIPTLPVFFTAASARGIRHQYGPADVVLANNVLAHVADIHGFVEGIETLLKPDGIAVLEVPYVCDLVAKCEFDTIYHQHLCYFSVKALDRLFASHGLCLNDVRRLPIHGGSLRLYVSRSRILTENAIRMLDSEMEMGWHTLDPYEHFADRARALRIALRNKLEDLRRPGCRVAAYGAAAKGTTLLGYCDLDRNTIDYVVDRNAFKHGRLMPGSWLPILPVEYLLEDQPHYCMLLPWNFKEEILEQQAEYRARGGQFIVPIPKLEVV